MVSLSFCHPIHFFEGTSFFQSTFWGVATNFKLFRYIFIIIYQFFSRALFEKMSKGGAGGAAANFDLFRYLFKKIYQFFSRAHFENMSKGGAGGAAANVLLLKKNEDK